jgi:hypothetical protein
MIDLVVNLSVTVLADQETLFKFRSEPLQRPEELRSEGLVLDLGVKMVEVQGSGTLFVPTKLTATALLDHH